jgi:ParB family chromosome partitioning protein
VGQGGELSERIMGWLVSVRRKGKKAGCHLVVPNPGRSTMTDTTTPEAEAITEHTRGELSHIDPNSLEGGDNVREYANVDKPFRDTVAEHGVLVPITAIRRPDGVIEVRNGQRRTVAARKVGLHTVPVYVLAASAADTSAETIDRIVHQLVTNDQQQYLTDAQRARGIQQMMDAVPSVTKVAKIHRIN